MARIRSLHPGQWTDEAFVSVSAFARLLVLGIRNEADDNGVFEWKPLTLKMRLFPADDVDVAAMLDEIEAAGHVMRFEDGGKQYGAIRNFCKWQSPKKPSTKYPTNSEVASFVGQPVSQECGASSEPVGNQYGTGSGKPAQREEGGGSRSGNPLSPKGDAPPKAKNGQRIPANWQPTSELVSWAEKRYPKLDIAREAEKFRDYWQAEAGARARKVDWTAAFRKWLGNAADYAPPARASPKSAGSYRI